MLEGSGATQTEWLEGFSHESWSDVWTGAKLTRELAALETALGGMPGATEGERASRVRRAIALFALLPEFNVLY